MPPHLFIFRVMGSRFVTDDDDEGGEKENEAGAGSSAVRRTRSKKKKKWTVDGGSRDRIDKPESKSMFISFFLSFRRRRRRRRRRLAVADRFGLLARSDSG